jgi:hypothetical protein
MHLRAKSQWKIHNITTNLSHKQSSSNASASQADGQHTDFARFTDQRSEQNRAPNNQSNKDLRIKNERGGGEPPRSIFFWRSSLNLLIITNLGSNRGCCEKPKKSLHQCSCEWWSTTDTCWWYHKPGDKWMRKHQREEARYPCTEKWPYMDTRAR